MKQTWMIIALIALFVFTIPLVTAEFSQEGIYLTDYSTNIHVTLIDMNKGFSVSSPYSGFDLCTCGTMTDTIQLTNTGSYTSHYSVETNKDYVVLSQSEFDIAPGTSQEVLLYINAPCSASGNQKLDISVTSVYGDTQTLSQTLSFKTCQNLVAGVYNKSLTQNVCEPFSTSFQIQNIGAFTEEYLIDVNKFDEYATLSSESIIIPSGSQADVFVHYNLPCDLYGQYELSYLVEARYSGLKAHLTQDLLVPQEYPFSLSGPQEVSSCVRDGLEFPVFLTNDNDFTETYAVSVDAPSFVNVAYPEIDGEPSRHVTLASGEQIVLPITIDVANPSKVGTYEIVFEAVSQSGDIVKELVINTSLLNCYDISTYDYSINEKVSNCGLDSSTQRFSVKNDGVGETDIGFVLYAPEFITLNQSAVHVGAHDEQDIELVYDLPNPNKTITHEVVIETYRAGNIVDVNTVFFKVEPVESCDSLVVSPHSKTKHISKDIISFNVKNDGLRYGVYDIAVQNLSAYLSLENNHSLMLGKSEQTALQFVVDQDFLQTALDASLIEEDLISTPHLVFTNQETGLVISKDIQITLAINHPWYINAYNWFNEQSTCRQVAMGLSILFIAALITLIIRASQRRVFSSRKILGLILLILIILGASAVLFTKGMPSRDTFYTTYDLETNSTRHVLLEEDRSRTLDLTQFFADPDNDIVSYNMTNYTDSYLSYEINSEDHELSLVSTEDWFGSTTIEMTATDSYNSTAVSDVIVVDVLPVEDYSFVELFDLGCEYANWILFTLLAISIWCIFSLATKKGKSKTKDGAKSVVVTQQAVTKKSSSIKKTKPVKKKVSTKKKVAKKTTKKSTPKVAKKAAKKASSKRSRK